MPEVRALVVLFLFAAPAHADLYRWVDPESGSVKFSTLPPADPHVSAALLPYTAPAPPPKPAAGAAKASTLAALEAQLRALASQLSGTPPRDLARAGDALREQALAYEALRLQLDRLDPAGTTRRAAETAAIAARQQAR